MAENRKGKDRHLVLSVTLADCEVQTFRAGGPGGQNQNKRETGVRVIHPESGARGESREHREQLRNKRAAFVRMTETPAFKLWIRRKCGQDAVEEAELTRRVVAQVERDLHPDNIVVEVMRCGSWERTV
jgi:protein subunit release factor B